MTPEETEALAHRWHIEIVQEGNLALADQVLSPDIVIHANGMEVRGLEGAKQLAGGLKAALPDIQITHHEAIVSGNRVAIRWTADATHQGDYFGVRPNGQRIHFEGIDFFHVEDGKLAEIWIEYDNFGPLQQTGAIPRPQ